MRFEKEESNPRIRWINSPDREIMIFRVLKKGSRRFGDLLEALGWGTLTLTNYLDNLTKKGCLTKKKEGRTVSYSLVSSHPYVESVLHFDTRPTQDIKLDLVTEERFIDGWVNSVNFALLTFIQDYILLGQRSTEQGQWIQSLIKVHIRDMIEVITFHGELLAIQIREGTLDSHKIWAERNKLLEQIKAEIQSLGISRTGEELNPNP